MRIFYPNIHNLPSSFMSWVFYGIVAFCLFLPLSLAAETAVWKVSHSDRTLYLAGTIHVLAQQDYPLPEEFNQAYQKSDMLVFETDLNAMGKPAVQASISERMRYQPGHSLKDDLSEKTYRLLTQYVSSQGLSMALFDSYKPPMVMIRLMMMELNRLGLAQAGVDNHFLQKAVREHKPLGELESLETQIHILENMGKGFEDEMILSTLEEMQELPTVMAAMKKAWREGNLKQLEDLAITPMRRDYPDLYRLLLVERNRSWLPVLERFLATPDVEMILVGALHLAAEQGLIQALKNKGYQVEPY
jgi:uncharacterized protein YbaP (TraB family)